MTVSLGILALLIVVIVCQYGINRELIAQNKNQIRINDSQIEINDGLLSIVDRIHREVFNSPIPNPPDLESDNGRPH